MTLLIEGLADVSPDYDVVFCDVWGVIHNGVTAFEQPCQALVRWREDCGPVILVSNSPRPSGDVAIQLDTLGVPREAWSAIVTSGDATRAMLKARAPGPAHCIGPQRDSSLYDGLELRFSNLEDASFIVCTGPWDDENDLPGDYAEDFRGAVARGIEMICVNPDKVVQRGDRLIYCAGALAEIYQQLGGRVSMAGKPYAPIYQIGFGTAQACLEAPLDRHRVLAIGDGIQTDLAGAAGQGLDALFIAAGINADLIPAGGDVPDKKAVDERLRHAGASARYVMAELSW